MIGVRYEPVTSKVKIVFIIKDLDLLHLGKVQKSWT